MSSESLNFEKTLRFEKDTITTVSPVVNLDWIMANCSGVDMMFNYYLKMVGQVKFEHCSSICISIATR